VRNPDGHARDLMRRRLLPPAPRRLPPVRDLRITERCEEFEDLRLNRKLFGAYRYGLLGDTHRPRHRNIESAIRRLQRYLTDGNMEHLLDAANLCEVEWVRPGSHPNPSLRPLDDGEHVQARSTL